MLIKTQIPLKTNGKIYPKDVLEKAIKDYMKTERNINGDIEIIDIKENEIGFEITCKIKNETTSASISLTKMLNKPISISLERGFGDLK